MTPPAKLDLALLDKIVGRKVDRKNANSLLIGMTIYPDIGLSKRHILAQFLAQTLWESNGLVDDRERWGPTPAQARYDTRTDLGNTAAADGDGYTNRGEGPIQLTGAKNRRRLTEGLTQKGFADVPDFVGNDNILTDPWEGLSAVWYWDDANLNRYAVNGDIEMVTVGVNGGRNGLDGRIGYYVRSALILLGHPVSKVLRDDIKAYQRTKVDLVEDGIAGKNTRAALHADLKAAPPIALAPGVPILLKWWPDEPRVSTAVSPPGTPVEERLVALEARYDDILRVLAAINEQIRAPQ